MQTAHSKFNLQMISNEFVQAEFQITYCKIKSRNLLPSNMHSPELASGVFLEWVPIQKLGPQKNCKDDCSAVSVPRWHQMLMAYPTPEHSRALELGWVTPLLQGTQHPGNTWNFHFSEDGRFSSMERQDTKGESRGAGGTHSTVLWFKTGQNTADGRNDY